MTSTASDTPGVDRQVTVLVFLVSLVLLFLCMRQTIFIYDEGIVLTNAMRVMSGDILHRDFYANYGPAQPYLLAGLFRLFGPSVIAERLFDVAVKAAIVATVHATLSSYCSRWAALIAAALCAAWLIVCGSHGYPVYPALLLMLIGSAALVAPLSGDASPLRPLWAGLSTGLLALFRYDIGALIFTAHAAAILLVCMLSQPDVRRRLGAVRQLLLPYAVGAALPIVPLLAWYWRADGLGAMLHDTFLFPLEYYARMRSLPFPGIWGLTPLLQHFTIYLPLAVMGALVCYLALCSPRLRAAWDDLQQQRHLAFMAVFGLLVPFAYLKGIVRVSELHLILAIVPSLMVLAVLASRRLSTARWFGPAVWALAALACASAGYAFASNIAYLQSNGLSAFHSMANNHVGPLRIGFAIEPERIGAINFLRRNSKPNDCLFSGLGRHDRITQNDNFMYFATQLHPATKWHHFDPGLQTRADVQAEMIRDLENCQPPHVMLDTTWDDIYEPNESALSSGVMLLDDYLRTRYEQVWQGGKLSIWRRKSTVKP